MFLVQAIYYEGHNSTLSKTETNTSATVDLLSSYALEAVQSKSEHGCDRRWKLEKYFPQRNCSLRPRKILVSMLPRDMVEPGAGSLWNTWSESASRLQERKFQVGIGASWRFLTYSWPLLEWVGATGSNRRVLRELEPVQVRLRKVDHVSSWDEDDCEIVSSVFGAHHAVRGWF